MKYSTNKTAQELLYDYTVIVELQFLYEAFKAFCSREIPKRTSKSSFMRFVDKFCEEEVPRVIIQKPVHSSDIFSVEVIDAVLWNTIAEFQYKALDLFVKSITVCLLDYTDRITINKLLKQLKCVTDAAVCANVQLLDAHRGCLFYGEQ